MSRAAHVPGSTHTHSSLGRFSDGAAAIVSVKQANTAGLLCPYHADRVFKRTVHALQCLGGPPSTKGDTLLSEGQARACRKAETYLTSLLHSNDNGSHLIIHPAGAANPLQHPARLIRPLSLSARLSGESSSSSIPKNTSSAGTPARMQSSC